MKKPETTYYTFLTGVPGPIAELRLRSDGTSLCAIDFDAAAAPPENTDCKRADDLPVLRQASRELREYFAGQRQVFTVPLALAGTAFQRTVWTELCRIPYGATWSYGELARRIGRPAASRAVGAANGQNPVPIIVPCHRVIGKSGQLTGYGGGLPRKQQLLALEQWVLDQGLPLSGRQRAPAG
jgi:methylated-DNA-[protein]-cysteine S-methyltransferase